MALQAALVPDGVHESGVMGAAAFLRRAADLFVDGTVQSALINDRPPKSGAEAGAPITFRAPLDQGGVARIRPATVPFLAVASGSARDCMPRVIP